MKKLMMLLAVAALASLVGVAGGGLAETGKQSAMNDMPQNLVSVRYMINDVDAASAFYTKHLGFKMEQDAAPAFASVTRGNLRLLLSGEKSSGRRPMKDGTKPVPGGWNRITLWVADLDAEIARLQ